MGSARGSMPLHNATYGGSTMSIHDQPRGQTGKAINTALNNTTSSQLRQKVNGVRRSTITRSKGIASRDGASCTADHEKRAKRLVLSIIRCGRRA